MKKGSIKVFWEGTRKSKFTVHYFIWNPIKGKVVNSDEAKKRVSQEIKRRRSKIDSEYDVMYGRSHGKKYLTFTFSPKPLSNVIFVFPKKYRKDAKDVISGIKIEL